MMSGPMIAGKGDVKISTTARNDDRFQYKHHVFWRASDGVDTQKNRYGASTLEHDYSLTDQHTWASLHDPLKPFNYDSHNEMKWPKEFSSSTTHKPLRTTQFNKGETKWVHTYPGGNTAEEGFSNEIFMASDLPSGVGLKVLLELRRMTEGQDTVALEYQDLLLNAPDDIVKSIIYRDFFRIEVKFPGFVTLPNVSTHTINPLGNFIRFPSGQEFSLGGDINKILQKPKISNKELIKSLTNFIKKNYGENSRKMNPKLIKKFKPNISKNPGFFTAFSTYLEKQLNERETVFSTQTTITDFLKILKTIDSKPSKKRYSKLTDCAGGAGGPRKAAKPNSPSTTQIIEEPIGPGAKAHLYNRIKDKPDTYWGAIFGFNSSFTYKWFTDLYPPDSTEDDVCGIDSSLNLYFKDVIRKFNPTLPTTVKAHRKEHVWDISVEQLGRKVSILLGKIIDTLITHRRLKDQVKRDISAFLHSYSSTSVTITRDVDFDRTGYTSNYEFLEPALLILNELASYPENIATRTLYDCLNTIKEQSEAKVSAAFISLKDGRMWPASIDGTLPTFQALSRSNLRELKLKTPSLTPVEKEINHFILNNLRLFKATMNSKQIMDDMAFLGQEERCRRHQSRTASNNTNRNITTSGMGDFAFTRLAVEILDASTSVVEVRPSGSTIEAWERDVLNPTTPEGTSMKPAIYLGTDPVDGLGRRSNVSMSGIELRKLCYSPGNKMKLAYPQSGRDQEMRMLQPHETVFIGDDIIEGYCLSVTLELRRILGQQRLSEPIPTSVDSVESDDCGAAAAAGSKGSASVEVFFAQLLSEIRAGRPRMLQILLDKLIPAQVAFPVGLSLRSLVTTVHREV